MKDNITLTLTFENYKHPEDGTFLVAAGTIIERVLDEAGREVLNNKGKPLHKRIDFIQPADQMAKNLSEMVDEVVRHGLKNYEDQKDKKENSHHKTKEKGRSEKGAKKAKEKN